MKFLLFFSVTALALAGIAHAQQPKARATPAVPGAPQADPAPPPGWNARCASAGREVPLECVMEQTAVLTKTGQLVVLVNIRVPGDTRAPVLLAQLPLGLNLPSGARMQVDDRGSVELPIQTCEARGCFSGTSVAPELLASMKTGKQLKISFQTLAKETITIPMSLGDFATTYDKIK